MKYITEDVLRDQYKKEPFTGYQLEEGARLTPGAIQFLADRGINMFADGTPMDIGNGTPISKKNHSQKNKKDISPSIKKKYVAKITKLEAEFLFTGEALLEKDVFLAQQILELAKKVEELKQLPEGQSLTEMIFKECTGIKEENSLSDVGDCFGITPFHVQMEKGKQIVLLHRLRSELRETALEIVDFCEDNYCQEMLGRIELIANNLSQMICLAVGGKECQRQI